MAADVAFADPLVLRRRQFAGFFVDGNEAGQVSGFEFGAAVVAAGEKNAAALMAEIEALKSVIKEKEKSEEELQENILRLESEIESRDKKIQADIKYCEGVVREVNDLRQKIKAYRLKVK